MFVYNSSLLVSNVDDKVIIVRVPSELPLGINLHKQIYVSCHT